VLVGQNVGDAGDAGAARPEAVLGAWLVQPADRGQVLAKVDLAVDPSAPAGTALVDAVGTARAEAVIAELVPQIAALERSLAGWEKDPAADPKFLAEKREELAAKRAERAALAKDPLRKPARGSWFVLERVPVKRKLPCDPKVVAAKTTYDREVGEANLAAARDERPPPVPPGGAGYVGIEECDFCHEEEVALWRRTRHARAFDTLVEVGKQWSRDCIGCHVTGWLEPGGSTLAASEALRAVQCEACHGPAARHVDADGKEKPKSLVRRPDADRCLLSCHTPEHSDTFRYEAYLRDVLDKGHGDKVREELGAGPTGHELRAAALAKAGRDVGAGCRK